MTDSMAKTNLRDWTKVIASAKKTEADARDAVGDVAADGVDALTEAIGRLQECTRELLAERARLIAAAGPVLRSDSIAGRNAAHVLESMTAGEMSLRDIGAVSGVTGRHLWKTLGLLRSRGQVVTRGSRRSLLYARVVDAEMGRGDGGGNDRG
jgi:hypothetical protein